MSDPLAGLEETRDPSEGKRILAKLAAELERRGITAEEIGRLSRISMWQGLTKNDDGEAEIHDLYGFQLAPSWDAGPAWPVVQPATPVRLPPLRGKPRSPNSMRTTLVLPDPQFGYRRLADGDMIPMQDEAAIECALLLARAIKPDAIINLGDHSDFAEWSSKFAVLPEFVLMTQPTLEAGHQFLARQREVCDDVTLLDGNHDDRIAKAITKNAMAALRLKPAGKPPETWPVLSIPNLLSLDDIGVNYVGAYPAGRHKVTAGNDEHSPLIAVHGEKLDLVKVARAERQSFIQGHTHHQGLTRVTYEIDGRPWLVWAMSPGCLCRTDGVVPSTKSGEDAHGRPVVRWEDWHQGVALITEYDDGAWSPQIIDIHRGRALYGGKIYEAA